MTSRPSQPADTTQMSATDVSSRRAASPHQSMFLRMLLRAAMLRRGRATSALLAMIVAAAVATAMMNLYVDVQAKLRTEFRNYGANIVIVDNGRGSIHRFQPCPVARSLVEGQCLARRCRRSAGRDACRGCGKPAGEVFRPELSRTHGSRQACWNARDGGRRGQPHLHVPI